LFAADRIKSCLQQQYQPKINQRKKFGQQGIYQRLADNDVEVIEMITQDGDAQKAIPRPGVDTRYRSYRFASPSLPQPNGHTFRLDGLLYYKYHFGR